MKKVLFLTRSCSNKQGGKEIYNYNLYNSINNGEINLISTSGSILNLTWFYPYSFFRGLLTRNIERIHLGDNFMLPLGILLKRIKKVPLSLTVYGLELTYPNKLYQKLFVKPIKNVDEIIAISNETEKQTEKLISNKTKIKVIPCGINPSEFETKKKINQMKKELESKYKLDLQNKKILLTSGRLVKRKGVEWFIRNAMPKLEEKYIYLVSGEGKEKESIQIAIKENKLESRVFLLGRTSFEDLKSLYHISDIFMMPNIKVEGDMEGFGIVLIEAGSCGTPVIASNIEGIKDAVIEGKTGYLIKEKDVNGFIQKIKDCKLNKNNIRKIINSKFDWKNIAEEYRKVWR